jgi:hypothetical protein
MLQNIKHVLRNPDRWSRWVKDFVLDVRFGKRYLGRAILNEDQSRGWCNTTSTDYEALAIMFSKISVRKDDVIVDVGCGKGRVFNWLLSRHIKNRLIGIEVHPEVAQFTRKRLRSYLQIEIRTGNILENEIFPSNGTIFYLFNPFSEIVIRKFADKIEEKIKQGVFVHKNRPLIIYYNCCHLNIFEGNPIWNIKKCGHITTMNLPAAIIEPSAINLSFRN